MVIALLVILGVDLIVLVVFLAFVLGRKRSVTRQPGVFHATVEIPAHSDDLDRVSGPFRPAEVGHV